MNNNLYKTESNTVLRFYEDAVKNNFLSEKEGKPVYDTVLMAEVITPGQAASTLTVEVERTLNAAAGVDENGNRKVKRTGHYPRYQKQIEAFKGNDEHGVVDDGTPIGTWAMIDKGTAETLRAANIFTVEALASVADSALMNLGTGARTLRDQAKSWMTARTFGVPDAQNTAALNKAQTRIAELEEEVRDLRARLDAYSDAEPTRDPEPQDAELATPLV